MLTEMADSSRRTQDRLDELYEINKTQMMDAQQRYKDYGIPAENRYFDMVSRYSEPQEAERQATAALGDVRMAQETQRQQIVRRLGAAGVDPTSGVAVSAMTDMAVLGAAAEANAKTRARDAARRMGLALTADAANFGRGGMSGVLSFGQQAGGNAQGSFGVASGALQGANSSAGVPLAGYGQGMQGYQANMSTYASLGKASMDAQAANAAGWGNFLGTIAGLPFPKPGG